MNDLKVDETKFNEWWEDNYMNVSADRSEAFDIYTLGIKHQQAKVEEANKGMNFYFNLAQKNGAERNDLQKRVNAVTRLAQTLWEKSNEKHKRGKVWESKALGECADEILDVLEQALKGEGQ